MVIKIIQIVRKYLAKSPNNYSFTRVALFAWKNVNYARVVLLSFMLLLIYYSIYAIICWSAYDNEPIFRFLDRILGIFTAILAVGIWYYELLERWENSLPKKLNAHFIYHGRIIASVYNAYLSNEGDIRAWGQHLGGHMVQKVILEKIAKGDIPEEPMITKEGSPYFLQFYPYIKQRPRELSPDMNRWIYNVCFFLSKDEPHVKYIRMDIDEGIVNNDNYIQQYNVRPVFIVDTFDEVVPDVEDKSMEGITI